MSPTPDAYRVKALTGKEYSCLDIRFRFHLRDEAWTNAIREGHRGILRAGCVVKCRVHGGRKKAAAEAFSAQRNSQLVESSFDRGAGHGGCDRSFSQ
eukprot:1797639-Rhodomonas_salina.1